MLLEMTEIGKYCWEKLKSTMFVLARCQDHNMLSDTCSEENVTKRNSRVHGRFGDQDVCDVPNKEMCSGLVLEKLIVLTFLVILQRFIHIPKMPNIVQSEVFCFLEKSTRRELFGTSTSL